MEWHLRADDPTEKSLTELRRQVGLLVGAYGQGRESAREMACEIIERVQHDIQESEKVKAAPMEVEDMSQEMRERVEADAQAAARTCFPGIPLVPTEEYGASKDLCRHVVLTFCELTAYLMGGDMDATQKARGRARHEGDPVRSCGEPVRGVMGRACAILASALILR
eukprot:12952029-Alexandrium_andersonii.AAC.1